jgi:hypothetical protein
MYGKAGAVTIINNCDSYVYTGGMDITTARNISQRLNQPVDEVLALALGMFAVFRRGEYPKVVPRYPILEDPLFQQITQVEKEHRQEIISCR